jgi:hypothetical protein
MAGKRGRWVRNPFYWPGIERRRLEDIAWQGWSPFGSVGQEPLIWQEDEGDGSQGKSGRRPSLMEDQTTRGMALLRERVRSGPSFASKIAAVHWLRKPERGLHIDPIISDRTVMRFVVDPLWPKRKRTK